MRKKTENAAATADDHHVHHPDAFYDVDFHILLYDEHIMSTSKTVDIIENQTDTNNHTNTTADHTPLLGPKGQSCEPQGADVVPFGNAHTATREDHCVDATTITGRYAGDAVGPTGVWNLY